MTNENLTSQSPEVEKSPLRAIFVIVAGILILLAIALLHGPCDPAPEPVPADCKPGQPCPVDHGATGPIEAPSDIVRDTV